MHKERKAQKGERQAYFKTFIMRFDLESHTEARSPFVVPFGSNRLKIADAAIGIAIKEFFSIPASPQGFVLIGKYVRVNEALTLDKLAPSKISVGRLSLRVKHFGLSEPGG